MIHSLSARYRPHIARALFGLFYMQLIAPVYAFNKLYKTVPLTYQADITVYGKEKRGSNEKTRHGLNIFHGIYQSAKPVNVDGVQLPTGNSTSRTLNIGGPSSPEASNFKAVGADKLVNLFTGDFSYSIPLLDVGGYPVNLFYTGGITMDQEASWVGLGWNLNPGTVSRNMRGVPMILMETIR